MESFNKLGINKYEPNSWYHIQRKQWRACSNDTLQKRSSSSSFMDVSSSNDQRLAHISLSLCFDSQILVWVRDMVLLITFSNSNKENKLSGAAFRNRCSWILPKIHLCWNLFLKRDIKKIFSCEFPEIFKNVFYTEHPKVTASENRFHTAWKVSKYGVFSGPYFPVFGLNTEYSVNLHVQSEYRNIWTRKNSVFGHFSRSVTFRRAPF